jgi:MtN3 and saliva related transmembrane protein
MQWYFIGTAAALLTTFGFVPQVIKMFRTKSVRDISLPTFIQFSIGMSLWALYGFHLRDVVIISANGIGVLILVIAIVLYLYYSGRYIKRNEGSIP